MKTPQDYEHENRQLRVRLAEYENERKRLYDDHHQRVHAVEQVRHAIDEAIAFTGRWADMARLDESGFRAAFRKRMTEAGRLNQFFIFAKGHFEDALRGLSVGEPERFAHENDKEEDGVVSMVRQESDQKPATE